MLDFVAYVRKKWSELSGNPAYPGTAIDELSIKPTAFVMGDFHNSLVEIRRTNDITKWETMSSDELDRFGGKFFIDRIKGATASTVVRIRLNSKVDMNMHSGVTASSTSSITFRPATPGIISKNAIRKSDDVYSAFYVDVPFIATSAGSTYNIAANSINKLNGVDFEYVSVYNPMPVVNGSKEETNEEYYNRLRYAINDRSMSTSRGVYAMLRSEFPNVSSIYISKAGDGYMMRDLADAVDASYTKQHLSFLGKTASSSTVRHNAYFEIFPPSPTTSMGFTNWGPHSAKSNSNYPMTIATAVKETPGAVNSNMSKFNDPAFFGYDVNNEFSSDMYSGLYFNDYNTVANVSTSDLLNIKFEGVSSSSKVQISSLLDWVYGASGMPIGDFGSVKDTANVDGVAYFSSNSICISGLANDPISVGKDISKRTGVKITGEITIPNVKETEAYVIVGGKDNTKVSAFSGIGFGIRLTGDYLGTDDTSSESYNARLFISNTAYDTNMYFVDSEFTDGDYSSTTSGLNSIAERGITIEPGKPYSFEFIINDDASITLMIRKMATTSYSEVEFKMDIANNSILANEYDKDGFTSISSKKYGTMLKFTVDASRSTATATDLWVVKNLKAFDTNKARATALLTFDVTGVDKSVDISLRAFGSGAIGDGVGQGYQAFIWSKDMRTPTPYATYDGGWVELSGITNPDGSKNAMTGLLKHTINNVGKYSVSNNYGDNIYLMLVASGSSRASIEFNEDSVGDLASSLTVDYVSVDSINSTRYHTRNKADVYVTTVRCSDIDSTLNSEAVPTRDGYYELSSRSGFKMPIRGIKSVIINRGTSSETYLTGSDYSLYQSDSNTAGSVNEVQKLVLYTSYTPNRVYVEYSVYPDIDSIQTSLSSGSNEQVYGDVLVRHKNAANVDISVKFSGKYDSKTVVSKIREYIDDNNSGSLSSSELVTYLYKNEIVNSIFGDVSMAYDRVVDGNVVSGTTTSTITIDPIEFFFGRNISAERI